MENVDTDILILHEGHEDEYGDDEDGIVEEQSRRQTDLKLHRRRADEVALGGTSEPEAEEKADDREER